MPYIETAYRGRMKMLQACFGGGDAQAPGDKPKPTEKMTPKLFAAMFGARKG
jgi:hypothetical protein